MGDSRADRERLAHRRATGARRPEAATRRPARVLAPLAFGVAVPLFIGWWIWRLDFGDPEPWDKDDYWLKMVVLGLALGAASGRAWWNVPLVAVSLTLPQLLSLLRGPETDWTALGIFLMVAVVAPLIALGAAGGVFVRRLIDPRR